MAPKLKLPNRDIEVSSSIETNSNINKETKMSNRFQGTKVTKKVKVMNLEVEIKKLTAAQVRKIQELSKPIEGTEADNLSILFAVICEGCDELAELSKEELADFAMDELNNLSSDILKFSGLVTK